MQNSSHNCANILSISSQPNHANDIEKPLAKMVMDGTPARLPFFISFFGAVPPFANKPIIFEKNLNANHEKLENNNVVLL